MTFQEINALPDKDFLEAMIGRAFSYFGSSRHQTKYSITKSPSDPNEYRVWESFMGSEWRWVEDVIIDVSETRIIIRAFAAWTYDESVVDRSLIELLPFEKGAEA